MSYCNFVNHPDNVQFRLAGGLTLVLTAVAYKLMLSNTLPTISYLTLVDKYVLTQIFLLTVLVVGFAILHLFYRHFKYTIDFTIEPVNCSQMFHYWAPEDSCELQAFANFTDLLTIGVHGSMQLISSLYFMAVAFQKSRKSATSLMQQEQHYKQFLRECKELRDRMWKQNIILPAPSHTYNSVRGTGKATMTHLTVGDRNGGTGLGFMGGSLTNIMDSRMHNPGRHSTLNYSSNQLKNSDKHKFVQED
ncbi:uncharacterized protein LOC134846505 [Symsagittifera roscoffensis]|uniref:uncharacterized protein LOC134846505 n=1 Tax=Symsagittifera roscoffensis TaxID=84072 RepID=UPI00307B700E